MIQVMMDLETMGNSHNAAIVEIAAVKFDPAKGCILDDFGRKVDLESSIDIGLEVNPATIIWWMQQSDEARKNVTDTSGAITIKEALVDFAQWYGPDLLPIWGNGVASDNVWMKSAFDKADLTCPWTHKQDRCYRTIRELCPPDLHTPDIGTKHKAMDDAIFQATHLMAILGTLPSGNGLM